MKSTRKAYGEFLESVGKDENVVVLDADLASATKTNMFMEKYPERHIDVGIAEQDLVGTACGLALSGKTVFASTFAIFMAGRAYDQVRNTAAYSHVNVNLCATHAGVMVGEDGPTHQCIEDVALMNVVPDMKILSPADDISTKKILKVCMNEEGPKYIRLGRSDVEDIYDETYEFKIGGSHIFGEGNDGTVFAYGPTVSIALNAQNDLKEKGINIRVVDLYSIKPVDKEAIINCAKETDKLISIEDHSTIGGIGSIVSNVLSESYPKKLEKIGIPDRFGKSGSAKAVYEYFGLTKENIEGKF